MTGDFSDPRGQPKIAPGWAKLDARPSANGLALIDGFAWLAAVLAVVIQQGAIISSPVLTHLSTVTGAVDAQANIFNTVGVSLNIALLAPLCLLRRRRFFAFNVVERKRCRNHTRRPYERYDKPWLSREANSVLLCPGPRQQFIEFLRGPAIDELGEDARSGVIWGIPGKVNVRELLLQGIAQ
jgi:hypothetical protein